MPKYDKKEEKVLFGEKDTKGLPLSDVPIPVTFGLLNGKVMVDPGFDEEKAIETRLTVTTKKNGNITALQKGNPGSFTVENLEEAADISINKGNEIRKLIEKSL